MTPEYWRKVKNVLEQVTEVDPVQRVEFLQSACGTDADLRRDVESFLEFDHPADDRFENPAYSFGEQIDAANSSTSYIGKVIGRYRIIGELGRGGMGLVFLAERSDGTFEQEVALKLIKRGMDTDAVLQRFLNERRILASLVHPNIAHLIDGGTTDDGVPYFVMERVEGESIIEYAANQKLSVDDKLRLFGEVASVVSYAHQNLVIHRDLKPSNILVTADGTPKLLDFGIAKLLTSASGGIITATQQFVLTPEYASPEQVRSEQLTTATDVYSLGVILYELLTGERPFKTENKSVGEMIRVICETDPSAPSRVDRPEAARLKGDLDNIVLKAIRKEPERRYHSVEQFNEDIRRHLERLPVTAASDSWTYRLKKFTSRHRYGVIAGALILLTLLAGMVATLYQASIARRERAKAEQRFNDVRQLANSFMFEINEKIGESPIKARELLVTRASEYLDKLAAEAEGDTELQGELASAYEKIGMVQAELFDPSLGKTSDALASHQKSLEIRERLFGADKHNVSKGMDVFHSRMFIGDLNSMSGRIADAHETYLQATQLGVDLLKLDPENTEVRTGLCHGYGRMGQNVLRSGSLGSALEYYQRSLELAQQLLAEAPDDRQRQRTLGIIFNYVGYVKMEMLQFDESSTYFQKELEIDEKILATEPQNVRFRRDVGDAELWLGISDGEAGRIQQSLSHLQRSTDLEKALLDGDPANFGYRNAIADCYVELGKILTKKGDFNKAVKYFNDAITNYESVWNADRLDLNAKGQILLTRRHLAESLTQMGNVQRAAAIYSQALGDYDELIKNDPVNTKWQSDLAICQLRAGENLRKQNDMLSATQHFKAAEGLLTALTANSPENARLRRDADLTESYLAATK